FCSTASASWRAWRSISSRTPLQCSNTAGSMTRSRATCPPVERARRQAKRSAAWNSGESSAMTRNLRWLMGRTVSEAGPFGKPRPPHGSRALAPEADDLLHLGEQRRGLVAGPLGAGGEDAVDLGGIGQVAAHLLGHRPQHRDGELGQLRLEGPEALAGILGQHLLGGLSGQRRIDADQVLRLRPA